MARRRPERVGYRPPKGSFWQGRSATGPERATQQTDMTLAEFVEAVFVPEHVALKKPSGRTHFRAILKHVLRPDEVERIFQTADGRSKTKLETLPDWPYIGHLRLRDTRPDNVQRLISAAEARGYSTQTVKHIRNVVRGIFGLATKKRWFSGDNPASAVVLPEITRKKAHTLTLAQVRQVLGVMRYPEREMALISILTSMNVAEICGLQWKHVNLTDTWSDQDGEQIPPKTIAVRQEWYLGQLGSVNGKSRNQNLPIPNTLLPILRELKLRPKFTASDDFVLVSRAGTPINETNIAARRLKPIGKALEMPWLSWQVFRRTHAALPYLLGMEFREYAVPGRTALLVREPLPYAHRISCSHHPVCTTRTAIVPSDLANKPTADPNE
jgi:integrase